MAGLVMPWNTNVKDQLGPNFRRVPASLSQLRDVTEVDYHLNVVAENLAVPLGAPLAQPLAALASAAHPVSVSGV